VLMTDALKPRGMSDMPHLSAIKSIIETTGMGRYRWSHRNNGVWHGYDGATAEAEPASLEDVAELPCRNVELKLNW